MHVDNVERRECGVDNGLDRGHVDVLVDNVDVDVDKLSARQDGTAPVVSSNTVAVEHTDQPTIAIMK